MTSQKKILAVDNDLSFLKILSEWFEFQGFAITTTPDGSHALDLMEKESFDAVILDVIMGPPSGMDILKNFLNSK